MTVSANLPFYVQSRKRHDIDKIAYSNSSRIFKLHAQGRPPLLSRNKYSLIQHNKTRKRKEKKKTTKRHTQKKQTYYSIKFNE